MSTKKRGRATRQAPLIGTKPGDPLITCTKPIYTEEQARKMARERRSISKLPISAYSCPFGDHWHIGRKYKGKRAR